MSRIAFPVAWRRILAGLIILFGCASLLADTRRQATEPHGTLTVVYVGADDCGPCRAWRRDERPAFLGSGVFPAIEYREVVAARLYDLLAEAEWPADLAFLREQVRSRPGAPQWFVMRDGRMIAWESGLSAWQRVVWPTIRWQATTSHTG